MSVAELLENMINRIRDVGFEAVFRKYYSVYRAEVTDNEDKEGRGRVELKVPSLFGEQKLTQLAEPRDFRGSGPGKGEFYPPEIGDFVFVEFECGDPNFPIYSGGWYAKEEVPEDFEYVEKKPVIRGFVTKTGHSVKFDETEEKGKIIIKSAGNHFLILDDTTDKEGLFLMHSSGAQGQIDKNGSIKFFAQNGAFVNIDSDPEAEEPAVTVTSKDGAYVSVGKEVKMSDSSGEHFLTVNEKGITQNSSADAIINTKSLGVTVGTISLQDTLKAGLAVGNGKVALGLGPIEVIDAIIKFIDALLQAPTLVPTGVGPSGPIGPPASVQLLALKVQLTTIMGTLS